MHPRTTFVLLLLAGGGLHAKTVVVAPSGTSTGSGSVASPMDVVTAVAGISAGDTILVQAGTYALSATIRIDSLNNGIEGKRKVLRAAPGARPVFDYSAQAYGAANRGILLQGNWWAIEGIEVANAGDNGIKIEGNHNRIANCVFHHNGDGGVQLGFAHETVNPDGAKCAYNEIVDCDSYLNFDWGTLGGNADGFACKMHNGKGNVFRGCRAWRNSDDGWDLYETDWPVEITDCWSWHNGDQTDFNDTYLAKAGKKMSSFSGNGNGIKLGGNGTGGDSKGQHVVTRCVAFNNRYKSLKGFDQNSHKGGVVVRNCTAWGNGYNYMFETEASGSTNEFANNISFSPKSGAGYEFTAGAILANNSWTLTSLTASAADFLDTTEASAGAPRDADGSLPDNGFARLAAGSDLIDQGKDLGLPYSGKAPDLGAFEWGSGSVGVAVRPIPSVEFHRVGGGFDVPDDGSGLTVVSIHDLRGARVRVAAGRPRDGRIVFDGALDGLRRGAWIVRVPRRTGQDLTARIVLP